MAEGPAFGTPDGLYSTPLGEIAPARPTGEEFDQPFPRRNLARRRKTSGDARPYRAATAIPPAWGRWLRQIGGEATGGMTLMQGVGKSPLLVLSRVDKGRVALLLSDQMWLWARDFDGGGPYLDLLRRLAHWLMKEPDLEEEALRARAKGRELTIERQSVKGEIPQATITGPDGKTTTVQLASVAPGLSRAMLSVDEDGLYRAERRRAHRARGGRAAEPARIPGSRLDAGEAAPARRGDRGRRASAGARRRRCRSRAAHRRDAAPSPSYAGADYIGVKRTGASAHRRRRPLAVGFLGLALLLGALVWMWRREAHARLKPQPLIVMSAAKRRVANDAGGSEGGPSPCCLRPVLPSVTSSCHLPDASSSGNASGGPADPLFARRPLRRRARRVMRGIGLRIDAVDLVCPAAVVLHDL